MMFLIFNKQFRAEERLVAELGRKIKKSETFRVSRRGNTETYSLDSMNIAFDVISHEIIARDKSGKIVFAMDCSYDANDEMQHQRFHWFHHLLVNVARKRESEIQQKKTQALQQASQDIAEDAETKRAKQQQEYLATIAATQRIHDL